MDLLIVVSTAAAHSVAAADRLRRMLATIPPCLALLGCAGSGGDSTARTSHHWDGEVRVYGALRAIFHEGETGAQVTLDAVLPNPDMYAVGALADLSGEITVIGGTAYLSYPAGEEGTRTDTLSATEAGATLLVAAEVPRWRALTTKDPIRFENLDEEIGQLAAAAGMSLEGRFPFLLEGDFEDLQWHVVDGSRLTTAGTSHQDHLAAAVKTSLPRASARLVGFYSRNDQGVFTHMGSRTHLHCVLDDPPAGGHVDHLVIPAGTTVKFPEGAGERPNRAMRRTGSAGR